MLETVISNTTPLITLMGLGELRLLKHFYTKVIIPQAVYEEVEQGRSRSAYQPVAEIDWIEVRPVQQMTSVGYLLDTLDRGEAEVIVLAGELQAGRVLLDEKAARHVASFHGIPYTGTLGILLKARQEGVIPALAPLLTRMTENGIWISDTLRMSVLRQANEL